MPTTGATPAAPAVLGPLERGLAVLRAISAADGHRHRPSELANRTGLARSTVDRVVATLTHLGYLRPAGRGLEPAPRLMEIGNGYLRSSGVPDALGPFAAALADEFDESVSVAVPDGTGVRFVAQHTRRRAMSLAFRIGDLLPAERCAAGTLFAARWSARQHAAWREHRRSGSGGTGFSVLPRLSGAPGTPDTAEFARRVTEAAEAGWAADDGLIEPGLIAVAVPVTDSSGQVAAAVSVVSHTSRHTVHSLAAAVLPRLRQDMPAMRRALAEAPGHPAAPERHAAAAPALATRRAKEQLGAGYLQSLARGLAVLRSLGARRGGLTLSEAADATGLPRATARRALLSLEHLGYAERDGRRFRMLPRVLELGHARLSALGFADILQPHLEELAAEAGESASATVLDGESIRYVARVPAYRIMTVNITVGTRFPAFATAMGRVLLAGLPAGEREAVLARTDLRPLTPRTVTDPHTLHALLDTTAAAGHALVDEELEAGLRSLAVPVRDARGRVVAALNLSTHAGGGTPEGTRSALLPVLTEARRRIEADLRVWAEPPAAPPSPPPAPHRPIRDERAD